MSRSNLVCKDLKIHRKKVYYHVITKEWNIILSKEMIAFTFLECKSRYRFFEAQFYWSFVSRLLVKKDET